MSKKIKSDYDIEGELLATTVKVRGGLGTEYMMADGTRTTATVSSPLTTKGDLYAFDTNNQRLPVGADTYILSANSAAPTGLEWIAQSAAFVPEPTFNGVFILRNNTTVGISKMKFENGYFVVGSYTEGYGYYYSTDGLTWTNATNGNARCEELAFGNSIWVATTDYGNSNSYWSDTIEGPWTSISDLGTSAQRVDFIADAGWFLAVGMLGAKIMKSTTGKSWTACANVPAKFWVDFTYSNGQYVFLAAGAATTAIGTTTNFTDWQIRTTPNGNWQQIAYGNGVHVVSAYTGGTGTHPVIRSTDNGATWTQIAIAAYTWVKSISFTAGKFWVGVSNELWSSVDGITWDLEVSSMSQTVDSLIWSSPHLRWVATAVSSLYSAEGALTSDPSIILTTKGDLHTFSDVDIRLGVGTNGQILSADSTAVTGLKWINPVGGGGALSTLTDVTITANTAGEILIWNGTSWVNNTLAEAMIASASHTHSAFARATSVLATNVVFSDIVVTNGIVTGISTRALTPANIGALATGITTLSGYGISDTMVNFDTACSNGNFAYQASTIVVANHGTASTAEVVNVCYGTSATPPAVGTTTFGTLYIQYLP